MAERYLVTLALFTVSLLGMLVHRIRRDTGGRVDTRYLQLAGMAASARVLFLAFGMLAETPATHPFFAVGGVATGLLSVHFVVLFAYSFPLNQPPPASLCWTLNVATVGFTLLAQHEALAAAMGPFLLLLFIVPYFALTLAFLRRNWRAATAPGARAPSAPVRLVQASVVAPWAVSFLSFAALDPAYHHRLPTWVFLVQALGMALVVVGGAGVAVLRYHLFEVRVLMTEVVLAVAASALLSGYVGLAAGPFHAWIAAETSPALAAVLATSVAVELSRVLFGALTRAVGRHDDTVARGQTGRGVVEKTLAVTARMVDPDAVLAMVSASMTEATACGVRFLRVGNLPPGAHTDVAAELAASMREHPRPFYSPGHAPELPEAVVHGMERLDAQLMVPVQRHEALYGVFVVGRETPAGRGATQVCVTLAEHLALKFENFALYAEAAQASRALADYRAFLEDLVESLPVGVAVVDADIRVRAWNRTLAEQTGVARDAALGRRYFEDLLPDRRDLRAEDLIAELQARPDHVAHRPAMRVDTPQGERFHDVSVAPFKDRLGQPTGVVVITEDVTDQVRLGRELEESRRLAALGAFAAAVAHDIRTPLTSIQMNVQILRAHAELSPSDREYLDIALTEIQRLERSVGEILEYARPVSLALTAARPLELVLDLVRTLEPVYAERGVTVHCEARADDSSAPAALDERHLRKALVNLIDNAVAATAPGGRVEVAAWTDDAGAHFEVRDHGRGIDAAQLERIFEPFYTTRADGTGLGLAIVREVARAHDGDVRVESAPGEGSRFTVTLPLRAEEALRAAS